MKRNKKYCLLIAYTFFIWAYPVLSQKTNLKIATTAYNHPEYIVWQHEGFKKHLKDMQYEFIVFNDATDELLKQKIDDTCKSLSIQSIRVPQDNRPLGKIHTWASYRHGQAMDYLMSYLIDTIEQNHNHDNESTTIVAIIDSDMFLIHDFSIIDYLEGYDIAGIPRGPENNFRAYIWPGLIFFNMNTLPDKEKISLAPEDSFGFDTGGALYHYLQAHPNLKKRFFNHGRLKLYKNDAVLSLESEPSRGYLLKCTACIKAVKKNQLSETSVCTHRKQLLKELNFNDSLIDIIDQQKVSPGAEFILGDTFFHIGGGSGYVEADKLLKQYFDKRIELFMSYILK